MTLGEFLKESRIKNELDINNVAFIVGKSKRHLEYIEKDERRPSYKLMVKLCELYKINEIPSIFFYCA